jgi:hypothetical protein
MGVRCQGDVLPNLLVAIADGWILRVNRLSIEHISDTSTATSKHHST